MSPERAAHHALAFAVQKLPWRAELCEASDFLLLILILIRGSSVAVRKDHEQDHDHEQDRLTETNYGCFAGNGFWLLRISASGVSLLVFPLKINRLGFSPNASVSALAWVLTTFKFSKITRNSLI